MSLPYESDPDEYFPSVEAFFDFRGRKREFEIDLLVQKTGYFLRATEKGCRGQARSYAFAAYSPASPFVALGLLREKIRRGLATRFLVKEGHHRQLSHDRMQGRVGDGGVVVDGAFISFDEFCAMLQVYEGFHFSLQIADPYEA